MELRWTVHLAKKEPRKTLVLVGCALLGGLLGVIVVGSFWMLPFGVLVILLGTADYLLPVRYSIDAAGARSKCGISTTAIGWEKVKRVVEGPDGVKLSPLETSSRLAPFRGVFLREDGNLQEIRTCVEYWRNQYASDVGATAHGRGKDEPGRAGGERDKEAPPRDACDSISGNA